MRSAWPALLLVIAVASASCTGLGLAMSAVALRVREDAVLGNVLFCVLLVFSGVSVAVSDLRGGWPRSLSGCRSRTPSTPRGRSPTAGRSATSGGLVLREIGVGALYAAGGLLLLRWLEEQSRRHATLERV